MITFVQTIQKLYAKECEMFCVSMKIVSNKQLFRNLSYEQINYT
jgi:hypothetical protein